MFRHLKVDMLSWAYPPPDDVRFVYSRFGPNSNIHLKGVEAVVAARQEELARIDQKQKVKHFINRFNASSKLHSSAT